MILSFFKVFFVGFVKSYFIFFCGINLVIINNKLININIVDCVEWMFFFKVVFFDLESIFKVFLFYGEF